MAQHALRACTPLHQQHEQGVLFQIQQLAERIVKISLETRMFSSIEDVGAFSLPCRDGSSDLDDVKSR